MSSVIGLCVHGNMYMVYDSCGGNETETYRTRSPKAIILEVPPDCEYPAGAPFGLLGFVGSWRLGQLIQSELVFTPQGIKELIEDSSLNNIVKHIATPIAEIAHNSNLEGEEIDFRLMLAIGGRLLLIVGDFGVLDLEDPYAAIGNGAQAAQALLERRYKTVAIGDEADDGLIDILLNNAMDAAANVAPFILRPYYKLKLQPVTEETND